MTKPSMPRPLVQISHTNPALSQKIKWAFARIMKQNCHLYKELETN